MSLAQREDSMSMEKNKLKNFCIHYWAQCGCKNQYRPRSQRMTRNTLKQINDHFSTISSEIYFLRIDLSLGPDFSKTPANWVQQFTLLWLNNVTVILSVTENQFSSEIQTALSGVFSCSHFNFRDKSVNSVHFRLFVPSRHSYSQNMAVEKRRNLSNKKKSAAFYESNFKQAWCLRNSFFYCILIVFSLPNLPFFWWCNKTGEQMLMWCTTVW